MRDSPIHQMRHHILPQFVEGDLQLCRFPALRRETRERCEKTDGNQEGQGTQCDLQLQQLKA